MARSTENSSAGIPGSPDNEGWRHFGDGIAGRIVAARLQGYSPSDLGYVDVQVDTNGVLQTAGGGGGGGSVTQGTSPWVTNDPGLPDTLGQKNMAGSTGVVLASDQAAIPVTASWASAQHVIVDTAPTTAVTGAFFQATQPVSIASMPSTPVTGTFWQATQPVSGTFFQATQPVSGTFWQATQPVSAASLPLPTGAATSALQTTISGQLPSALVSGRLSVDIGGQALAKLLATVDPVTFASPQHVIVDSGTLTSITNVVHIDDNAGSLTVDAADTTFGATVTPKAASTWDVSDRSGRALGTIANTSFNVGNFPASQTVAGTVALSNTGFNTTGTDGITAGLAATVKTYNGSNHLFVRDPSLAGILSEILMELRLANSYEEVST